MYKRVHYPHGPSPFVFLTFFLQMVNFFPKTTITVTIFCQKLPTFFCLLTFEVHFLIILKSECSQDFLGGTSRMASTEILSNAQLILHIAAALGSVLVWAGGPSSPRGMRQRQQETVGGRGCGWTPSRCFRWEGKVCLSEKLATVPVSAPGVCWYNSHHWGVGLF